MVNLYFCCRVACAWSVPHHVRGMQQTLLVQCQASGHGLELECPQEPTVLIETLQSSLGIRVRLEKIGDEDLIFSIDHNCVFY